MDQYHDLYIFSGADDPVRDHLDSLRADIGGLKPVRRDRIHVTLVKLGRYTRPSDMPVEQIVRALEGQSLPACELIFNKLILSTGYARLEADAGKSIAADLRDAIGRLLARSGISFDAASTPHVTLGYKPDGKGRRRIDPFQWKVDQIRLVESVYGQTIHRTLASWPLVNRQLSFGF